MRPGPMILAVVVPFLNEERCLGELLASIGLQSRPPDRLLLVDDGSTDSSREIAERFASAHENTQVLVRPQRSVGRDRLAAAGELRAFQWAVDQLDGEWDVVAKLDADLVLTPEVFATMLGAFEADTALGMAGPHLSTLRRSGTPARIRCPDGHVQGAVKFYRRECYEDISPIPAILGWDTIDEARARLRGWRTTSLATPGSDPFHVRPMGSHDGLLRGFRRWGVCAYGYGSSPLFVALGGLSRARDRPFLIGGANFVLGWLLAAARGMPRAEPELREFVRREQTLRLLRPLSRRSAT